MNDKNALPQVSLAIENSQDDTLTLLERATTEGERKKKARNEIKKQFSLSGQTSAICPSR